MSDPDREQAGVGRVWKALNDVPDPEIRDVSVVELGMIAGVEVDGDAVTVKVTPTFAACPAIPQIEDGIRTALGRAGFQNVEVAIVYDPPWTSDRITAEGCEKLKAFGLAPPPWMAGRPVQPQDLTAVTCPHCDSTDTTLESAFGSTLCRSIHYCNACRQSFERFKPVS